MRLGWKTLKEQSLGWDMGGIILAKRVRVASQSPLGWDATERLQQKHPPHPKLESRRRDPPRGRVALKSQQDKMRSEIGVGPGPGRTLRS